jgi:hypothetical protein
MAKIKLVLQPGQFSSFTSWYLESLWQEYFDIELYETTKSYDHNTLFVVWWMNTADQITSELVNRGHKVVVDNLWEHYNSAFETFYQLNNENWWWWNESLWWRSLGYDQYSPQKTYKRLALMPIRVQKPPRDIIVKKMQPYLEQMIWSYKDKRLPDDNYIVAEHPLEVNQRFMNPSWYDETCVSVVVETSQHTKVGLTVSEKSYKPLAFYHPLLIIGKPGALKFLKSQGFETFDNIFDERYDQEIDFARRLDIVIENLNNVTYEPYSALTQEKLMHNHNHFFDIELCKQKIIQEIIEPLLNYAET